MGRPTKYKPEYDEQAYKLCLLAATNKELARSFDVDVDTIKEWLNTYESFSASIKEGRETADANVSSSLYRKAIGYTLNEQKIEKDSDGNPVVVTVQRTFPPDVAACIFWLKNRTRARENAWRDKHEVEHGGEVQVSKIERVIVDAQGLQPVVDSTADVVDETELPGPDSTIQ